jgi:hypothetical protein
VSGRRGLSVALAASTFVMVSVVWAAWAAAGPSIGGASDDDQVKVSARDDYHTSNKPTSTGDGRPATEWYERIPTSLCANTHLTDASLIDRCPDPDDLDPDCPKGSLALEPLYKHTRTIGADGTPDEWGQARYQADGVRCVAPRDLAGAVRTAMKTVKVTPSPLHVQPGTTEVLVNMPAIVYTDPDPQVFELTLLGIPIELQAIPATYTWTFGQGAPPLITTDPGMPYPDQTVSFTYVHADPAVITLTTAWRARFRISGVVADPADDDAWTPVDGTLTTTSPAHPLTVVERIPHLVDDLADE